MYIFVRSNKLITPMKLTPRSKLHACFTLQKAPSTYIIITTIPSQVCSEPKILIKLLFVCLMEMVSNYLYHLISI